MSNRNAPIRPNTVNPEIVFIYDDDHRNNPQYLKRHPNVKVLPRHRRSGQAGRAGGQGRSGGLGRAGRLGRLGRGPSTSPAAPPPVINPPTPPEYSPPPEQGIGTETGSVPDNVSVSDLHIEPRIEPYDPTLDVSAPVEEEVHFFDLDQIASEDYDPFKDMLTYPESVILSIPEGSNQESIPVDTPPQTVTIDPNSFIVQTAADGSVTFKASVSYDIPSYLGDFEIVKTLSST